MEAFSGEERNRFSTAYSQISNQLKNSYRVNMRVVVLHPVK
jgi:hypothetical protein